MEHVKGRKMFDLENETYRSGNKSFKTKNRPKSLALTFERKRKCLTGQISPPHLSGD
jgi:hypothetical protein